MKKLKMMKKLYTPATQKLYRSISFSSRFLMATALTFFIQTKVFCQSGTSGDPFTELGHAWHVPSSGIYYFNISGTAFSTYVEAGNGWILIASGSASTNESSYSITTSLTLQSDKILPAVVYASTDIAQVRINATSGPALPFDVQTSDAQTLTNLRTDVTLSVNSNGSSWTGMGTSHMSKLYGCSSSASLSSRIYHACNNQTGLHWLMADNDEQVHFNNSDNDLNLWIRDNVASFLPVELSGFTARKTVHQVELSWHTASESNNKGFEIQRSPDSQNWATLAFVPGKGTTQEAQSYAYTDGQPLTGNNYYRLRQMDFDGKDEYSKVVSVDMGTEAKGIHLFPNPTSKTLTLNLGTGYYGEATFTIYDLMGKPVKTERLGLDGGFFQSEIDLEGIPTGLYLAKVQAGQEQWQERLIIK